MTPALNSVTCADALDFCRALPEASVNCVVTSPPYFALRDYGTAKWEGGDPDCQHSIGNQVQDNKAPGAITSGVRPGVDASHCRKCGAKRIDQQIGLEPTPAAYIAKLVELFREIRRVLRDDGVCFVNMGDSYAQTTVRHRRHLYTGVYESGGFEAGHQSADELIDNSFSTAKNGIAPKSLLGIPWRVAFALQDDDWILRSDIIWCLSGGTRIYAKTQKGEMPTTIKDLIRLRPETVKLWNGERWTQVLGWSETPRPDRSLEIELRSGERIGCTGNHEWPTQRGVVRADQLVVGDVIQTCQLPEPEPPKRPTMLDDEMIGWFVGLYIAEGSRSADTIQIASHVDETERFRRLCFLAAAYDGACKMHKRSGNSATININSPILNGVIDTYVSGRTAYDKHLDVRCWKRSNAFLRSVLDGYLSGDGHHDKKNNRWRLGFTDNDNLSTDLRTICARLGVTLRLRRTKHISNGVQFAGWRGEIRFVSTNHHNTKQSGEVIAIRASRARRFFDITVEDEPHLFSLASGVLTHNCKPNPMPESVTDRPTKAHEYIFLFVKQGDYWYDQDAVREKAQPSTLERDRYKRTGYAKENRDGFINHLDPHSGQYRDCSNGRNLRTVWDIPTEPTPFAHFATFPRKLVERCILAGCPAKVCAKCGAPWVRVVEREPMVIRRSDRSALGKYGQTQASGTMLSPARSRTLGFRPTCDCQTDTRPGVVFDPFMGSGTVALVARELSRNYLGCDLNPEYVALANERLARPYTPPLFTLDDPAPRAETLPLWEDGE